MVRKYKHAVFIPICLLLMQVVYSQTPENVTDRLTKSFLAYCKAVPREEIYIHSDREDYISGEDLWFKIYVIDRLSFKPSFNSRIVYFEILNSDKRPIIQKRILIDKGFGPGKIVLPDTLSTGLYTIRAYTNWMKNFLPDNCFVKDFRVYNAFSTKNFDGKHNNTTRRQLGTKGNSPNQNSEISLQIDNSKKDNLEIFVGTDNKFRTENQNLFYIFIQTHGNINHVSGEKFSGDNTRISVSKTLLNSGINQITIFNSRGEPVAEKYIYTPEKQIKTFDAISADSCALRDKLTIRIQDPEASMASDLTNLSISVAPVIPGMESLDIADYMVFGTEYGLSQTNSLAGRKIEKLPPEVIDSLLSNIKSNWIDWATILSGKMPDIKYQPESTNHLLFGKLVSGDSQSPIPGQYLFLNIPGKEASFQYAITDNNGNFSFYVHIDEAVKDLIIMPDDATKRHKIIIESSFSDHYIQSGVSVSTQPEGVLPQISKMGVNHQVQTIFAISSSAGPLKPVYQPLEPLRFYGKPDIELKLADYISLPAMNEIFFELLPGVSIKQKKSKYEISITEHINDRLVVSSPVLMIDGVIIRDASLIANLDPETVEKIDIIKGKYQVGKYVFPGMVNVISKTGDFSSIPLPDYMIRMPYRVVDPVWSFVSPDYSIPGTKESKIPDYRNTLYWNPSVRPDKDGKVTLDFWSSDNKADYLVNIEGTTSDGKPVSIKKIIRVR